MRSITNGLLMLIALGAVNARAQAPTYTVKLLTLSGLSNVTPSGINDGEEIVGYAENSAKQTVGFAVLKDGRLDTFSVPGAKATYPAHINNEGQIVGYYTDSNFQSHGFLDTTCLSGAVGQDTLRHSFKTIEEPSVPAGNTVLTGINHSGEIVGYTIAEAAGNTRYPGFFDRAGAFTLIYGNDLYTNPTAVNDNGEIVGFLSAPLGPNEGFIYNNGAYTDISVSKTNPYSYDPAAITKAGVVLVNATAFACCGNSGTWLWQAGIATEISFPIPGATPATIAASGLNERGQIVGYFNTQVQPLNSGFLANPTVPVIPASSQAFAAMPAGQATCSAQ